MTTYIMSRENRKRKRDIYRRALRGLDIYNDAVREMREIALDLAHDYASLDKKLQAKAKEVRNNLVPISDLPLRAFVDLPEDVG